MEDGNYVDGSIYYYAPNKGAPIFFMVGFILSALLHIYQCIHHHSWRLTGLYVFSSTIMAGGFAVREAGAFHYDSVNVYIVTVCLVYAAPPIFELANYYVLGRILYYVPHKSPIHPGRVLTTFAAISTIIEILSGNGAAYASNKSLQRSQQEAGHRLLKAALLMQVIVVSLFVCLALVFHRRVWRDAHLRRNRNVHNALATLYMSTSLLLARTLYRVVEYFSIADLHPENADVSVSPILRYEWYFYFFEATLMLVNTWLINIRHPRHYLPQSTKTYLSRDGITEITGPGYKEKRPLIVTVFDPFDLIGLINGRDKETAFWDQEEQRLGGGSSMSAQTPQMQATEQKDGSKERPTADEVV